MRAMRRVLFTGAGGAAAESIFEQWRHRYDLFFGDADVGNISPLIPEERCLSLPFASDPAFADRLIHLACDLSLDLIVPGVDEELLPLARKAEESSISIMVPDRLFVEAMLDKLKSASLISATGLSVPRTRLFSQATELTFPMIVKPRSGRGSRGVKTLSASGQLPAYLALAGNEDPDAFIAQDLAVGQEYTVFVAADRVGRLASVIPVKVITKRGITIRAEIDPCRVIHDYVEAFHGHFKPAGVYNIQLILTSDGCVLPFEVNPRVSTTFCLAIATGFDPIASFLDGHAGRIFTPEVRWRLHRTWRNTIVGI